MRVDKKTIVDEVWDDARIESFLDKEPMGDEQDAQFSILLNAYRGMRPEDFDRFLVRYRARGYDVNARSQSGKTLLETIAPHRKSAPFRELLEKG